MALRLALVIDGSQSGAAKALKDTAAQTQELGRAAAAASQNAGGSAAAIARIAPAANSAGAAIKGSSLQTANLAAQLQDIAVQLQSGQNPFQIALQQGTQINQVIGQQGAKGAVVALGAAFTSLINPVSLATVGIIAGIGLVTQTIGALAPKTETATEALKRHEAEIKAIVAGYDQASSAAGDYFKSAGRLPTGAVASDLEKQFKDLNKEATDFYAQARSQGAALSASLNSTDQAAGRLLTNFASGKITAAQLVTELTKLGNTDLGPLGFATRHYLIDPLIDAAQKAKQVQDALVGLSHVAVGTSVDQDLQFALDQQTQGQHSADQYKAQLAAINAISPAQQRLVAERQKELELDGQAISEARRRQEVEQAGALAYAQASHAITLADQERLRAANDNVAALQANLDVVGKSVGETARLQFEQQQLAAAYDAAAQSGTTVSEGYIAAIRKTATEVGNLQQKIAETQTLNDLAFQRSQLGRTDGEQGVAETLRGIYGDDYASYMDGAIASQIRLNDAMQQGKDLATSFGSTLINDAKQGKTGTEALADAFGNLGQQLLQIALNQAIAGLFSHLLGGLGLGGGGGTPGNFSIGGMATYDSGGYTGPGGRLEPAGVVHRGEVVWSQDDVRRHGGPAVVDAMRRGLRGYEGGGFVTALTSSGAATSGSGGAGSGFSSDQVLVQLRSGDIHLTGSGITMEDVLQSQAAANEELLAQIPVAVSAALSHPRRRA